MIRGRSLAVARVVAAYRMRPECITGHLDDGPIIDVLAWKLVLAYRPDRTGD